MPTTNSDAAQKRLLAGARRFQEVVYPRRKSLYQRLATAGQRPHTLFITCADSRVDPELITQSEPGEIFVCRNIGNLVPPYGEMLGGVSAIIEYAVTALRVSQVVVCGHADCGAMIGLLRPDKVAKLPAVANWLRHGEAALGSVRSRGLTEEHAVLDALIEVNVLLQLNHLRTHPSVAARLAKSALTLSGWVYDIGQGIIRIYDGARRQFLPLTRGEGLASGSSGA
jgi:carbonic anhydrase